MKQKVAKAMGVGALLDLILANRKELVEKAKVEDKCNRKPENDGVYESEERGRRRRKRMAFPRADFNKHRVGKVASHEKQ